MERGGELLLALVPPDYLKRGEAAVDSLGQGQGSFQKLSNPLAKDDENGSQPGYNDAERGALEQLIEEQTKP